MNKKLTRDEVECFLDDTGSIPVSVDLNNLSYIVKYKGEGKYYYYDIIDEIDWERAIKDFIIDYNKNNGILWRNGTWQKVAIKNYRSKAIAHVGGNSYGYDHEDYEYSSPVGWNGVASRAGYYSVQTSKKVELSDVQINKKVELSDVQINKLENNLSAGMEVVSLKSSVFDKADKKIVTKKTDYLSISTLYQLNDIEYDHSFSHFAANCGTRHSEKLTSYIGSNYYQKLQNIKITTKDDCFRIYTKMKLLKSLRTQMVQHAEFNFDGNMTIIYDDLNWFLAKLKT